jgi:hypothetical protein
MSAWGLALLCGVAALGSVDDAAAQPYSTSPACTWGGIGDGWALPTDTDVACVQQLAHDLAECKVTTRHARYRGLIVKRGGRAVAAAAAVAWGCRGSVRRGEYAA